jgi:imidazolonepropionase-like amidohydrolase
VGGTVISTRSRRVHRNVTVLLKGDRIAAMGPVGTVAIPKHANVIDVRGKYLIPGLMDGHIHFFQSGGLYTRPDGLDLRHRVPYEKHLRWVRKNMDDVFRRYIRSGITTVVDMGGPRWNFDVRAQARRARVAPRVFVAGPLIASYQPPALKTIDPPIVRVNTIAEGVAMVRRQVAQKADLIKIWYVVSKKLVAKGLALDADRFYPIVKAVIQESHKHKLPVYVHATELDTAKRAMRAGADVLVHSVRDKDVDAEFLRLAKQRGVKYIPTLWVFNSYAAVYSKQLKLLTVEHRRGNPAVISTLFDMHKLLSTELGERQKKLQKNPRPIVPDPVLLRNLKRVQEHGIIVAAGTDAGNVGVLHGPALFHDFALMKRAGLSNYEILVSATYNGARTLGRDQDLGAIEVGKLADIVVLGSDPLKDIMNTADTHLVIKGGQVFFPHQVLPLSSRDLAQIQLNAYNARDIDAFLSVYAPRVEVYDFPGRLKFRGREAMRHTYTAFFRKAKGLHCTLVKRIVQGRYVIDRERVVTGIPGREEIHATAIYEITGGLIRKVWFLK